MSANIGKAYVQIVPTTKGIQKALEDELNDEAGNAGKSAGVKFSSIFKKTLVIAGIGKALTASIMEGAKLEQSLGGIETIYKDSADEMVKYANEAYKTAGLSANSYMEQATSFGASLLQATGGDSKKAAEAANQAIIDMADNANKMGTPLENIQNAYQGFAKNNYTMLDNLKLGYGGTKEEMERLLQDATKLTGVKYDINNLKDVYDAVHVIQEQIGITGTTSLEASQTVSGSFASMKSSFSNFMGALALNENLMPSLLALVNTAKTFLFENLVPMVWNVIKSIGQLIIEGTPMLITSVSNLISNMIIGIQERLPEFIEFGLEIINKIIAGIVEYTSKLIDEVLNLITSVVTKIYENLPQFLQKGKEIITSILNGLIEYAPKIIGNISDLIINLVKLLAQNLPQFLTKGIQILSSLGSGLIQMMPDIISKIFTLIRNMLNKFIEKLPEFLKSGMELIVKLGVGIVKAIPGLLAKIPGIVSSVLKSFGKIVSGIFGVGRDIIFGLWEGIASVGDWIISKISGFVDSILGGIKSFFGIHSPSRVMANEVGKYLPQGLAVGIENNLRPVSKAMDEMGAIATRQFESNIGFSVNDINSIGKATQSGMVSMKEELTATFNATLALGEHTYKVLTRDITNEQQRQAQMEVAF